MSWKKHFTPVQTGNNPEGSYSPFTRAGSGSNPGPARTNYSSYLPDVYVGSPNRVERYGQYNTMDMDSEVNAALDILAEFTTQQNTQMWWGTSPGYFCFKILQKLTSWKSTISRKSKIAE